MSDDDKKTNPEGNEDETTNKDENQELADKLQKQFDEQLEQAKSEFKLKMDALDNKYKEAQKKADETAASKEQVKKSSDDKINDLADALKNMTTQLSNEKRDGAVNAELAGLDFVNPEMAKLARNTITSRLQKNDTGDWVGDNDKSVQEVVKEFSSDENFKALFKQPTQSGSNTAGKGGTPSEKTPDKDIKDMTPEELMTHFENQQS